MEGIIPLSEMKSDYFVYFKEMYCVIGERTKKRINLGDVVQVKVKEVDVEHARVEFSLQKFPKEEEEKGQNKERKIGEKNGNRNQNRRNQQKGKA